ncbi:peptidoglycan-binding protein [Streptomyces axinellae]|uniref:Peptidoglycan-binding protein n=1 Tax=Streptomyces axinellae TaxID=552788 RepID=A0ABP6CLH2_9ACTN
MRTAKGAAVALFAAWPLLLAPPAASPAAVAAARPLSADGLTATGPAPGEGRGLERFQAEHGLSRTGEMNPATAKALLNAPDSELHQVFRSAADLGRQQLANARTVIGVGKGARVPERGRVIALMAAMQESNFINYTKPVDHDSLGIFQQRPSAGWGTPRQITDVATASKLFYGVATFRTNPGLLQISGWEAMPPGEVCQAVQRSAHPESYAHWEPFARELLARESPSVKPIR